jgi:hypothetical protein
MSFVGSAGPLEGMSPSPRRVAGCASVLSPERARGGQPFACAGGRDGHLIPRHSAVCGSGNESIPRTSRRRLQKIPARTHESPQRRGRKALLSPGVPAYPRLRPEAP